MSIKAIKFSIPVKIKKVSVYFLAFFTLDLLIINTLSIIFKRTQADTFSLISWFTGLLNGQKRTTFVRENGQLLSVFSPLNMLNIICLYFLCPFMSACFYSLCI